MEEKEKTIMKDKKNLLNIVVIIFIAIIYISLMFSDSIWGDEGFTMNMVKNNFIDIVKRTAQDVHPPLYYFIAKIFTMIFGYSVTSVKLASMLPAILIMIFVNIKAKKLFGQKANWIALLFTLLIGFCPKCFTMNGELRMYSWAMFFVTCSGIYAYELYNNPKNKKVMALFILTSLGAAYTHYYALVAECFIYAFLMISLLLLNKKNWKTCMLLSLITIIGYIPWLPIFAKQFFVVKKGWWLAKFTAEDMLTFIKFLFYGEFTNLFLILFAFVTVRLLINIYTKRKDKEMWFAGLCIFASIMTVGLGCAASILIRPMFLSRYIYAVAGILFLGISVAICKIDYRNILRDALISIIILNLPFSYYETYKAEYKTGTNEFKKFVNENISTNETIILDKSDISYTVLPFYFRIMKRIL